MQLPQYAIIMKVGPHSGMSLEEILRSKQQEEQRGGCHYWGYSGTMCHPRRVIEFVSAVISETNRPPDLLLVATPSDYSSCLGPVGEYSTDGKVFHRFSTQVQLQGAQYAFVASNIRHIDQDIDLDDFEVVGGKNDGVRLSQHLRHRVNKACVRRCDNPRPSKKVRLAYLSSLVEPYAVWLREK